MTSGRWKTTTVRIALCALLPLIVVAGCSGQDEQDPPPVSEQIRDLEPATPVQPAADGTYQDRDPDAVLAALWRLDPCRLIAPDPGEPGTIDQYAPHGCSLTLRSSEVHLDAGQRLLPQERLQLGASEIAGAKAYVLPGDGPYDGCTSWLPVGVTQTIRIEDEVTQCGRVRTLLARAVKRIDDSRTRRPVPGVNGVDTCALLSNGLGSSRLAGRKVVFGDYGTFKEGIDTCTAISDDAVPQTTLAGSGYASLQLETAADQTLTFEEGVSDTETPAEYAASGWPAHFGTIRGRPVFGSRDGGCTMRWAESTTVLMLDTKSCEQGRQVAARMMKALDGPPGDRVAPQKPLLYGADESDVAASGACADYLPLWFGREYEPYTDLLPGPACHPYVEPDLPDGAAERVVAAEADPNVTCALATDVVRDEFARRLRPATLDVDVPAAWATNPGMRDKLPPPFRVRPCVFVDPERRIQVQVFVSSDPMAIHPDLADQLAENDSAMRVPMIPGTYGLGTGYLIGLGAKPDDPGYVAVFAGRRHRQTSGSGYYGAMQGSQDDAARVADTIVDEHLSS